MADHAPKVITTRQAKKQIGFFGKSLALYILLFMALSYGTELLQNFNPSIFMGMDPQAFSLAVSMILMLFITMVPFRRSAQKLHLNIHDYLKDPNLRGDRIFALVCIGIGIDLIMTSVSTLFYFLFPTNMAEYSFLGNFSTRDAIIENILYFMMFVIVKPICDEYIFRGVIQRQLGHYGRYFGVLGSAVLYAIAQVNIAQAFPAFFVGWYLSLITDRLKEELLKSRVVHADETPVTVKRDGREGMHRNYMWVYRSGEICETKPAIIYDYQRTRKADAPKEMLEGFEGRLVCDGYQVYHGIENDIPGLTVAGCWAHARRPFAEVVKTLGKEKAKNTAAYEALIQIEEIYRKDNALRNLLPKERKRQRRLQVKPLVNGFFDWCREEQKNVRAAGKTGEGITYCLNQEKYLRVFLTDPEVPLDNNPAERAIRPFCVGKKNWILIDTIKGAEASAILYSLAETAKANGLKPYNYFKHLLTEIPKHMDDTDLGFLEDLLPWSDKLPKDCRKQNA